MRRGEVFWGGLLILLGVLFYLRASGILSGDVLGWFWPLAIILTGVWILAGGFSKRLDFAHAEKFSIAREGARSASLSIAHGMGRIELMGGANPGDFLTGVAAAGMNRTSHLDGDRLEVRLEAGPSFLPFIGPEGGVWQFRLAQEIPTDLEIQGGASRLDLDLSDLQVTHFSFEGGASSLDLKLPRHPGNMRADIQAGAASLNLHVPPEVAVCFRIKSVGSLNIDESRFPRRQSGVYQSADYDTAADRAEVNIDGGATSISLT